MLGAFLFAEKQNYDKVQIACVAAGRVTKSPVIPVCATAPKSLFRPPAWIHGSVYPFLIG